MVEILIAAIAGFISFISPCVLPLVPAYIGYMSGRVTNTVSSQVSVSGTSGGAAVMTGPSLSTRFSTFTHGLAFVMGFTLVFVSLGILTALLVRTATIEGMIARIGGTLVIFFGLHFMGVLPRVFTWVRQRPAIIANPATSIAVTLFLAILLSWGFTGSVQVWDSSTYAGLNAEWTGALALVAIAFVILGMFLGGAYSQPETFWNKSMNSLESFLYADTRRQMDNGNSGLPGSALMGVVFAAGWTPCIGPTLGAAMTMAANGGDVGQAVALMTAYSLGLGIPFLITALLLDSAQGGLRRLKSHMGTLKLVSGGFLVIIGFMVASGQLQSISQRFTVQFGDISYRIEQCVVGTLEGDITLGQTGTCLGGSQTFEALAEQNREGDSATTDPIETGDASENNSGLVNTGDLTSITDAAEEAATGSTAETTTNSNLEVGLAVGNLAPNFETTTTGGETISLEDHRGDVVLLNFWFTECVPCRVEMPEFQRAFEEHADEGFTILAINREEDAETIQTFAEEIGGLDFPLLLDEEGDLQFEYNIFGYPSTFIIDRDGVILDVSFGGLTEAQIQEKIAEALS